MPLALLQISPRIECQLFANNQPELSVANSLLHFLTEDFPSPQGTTFAVRNRNYLMENELLNLFAKTLF